MAKGVRVHHLEVLLILGGRAGGQLVQPLACMVSQSAEPLKGCKKLIMPVHALSGHKGAHGKAIHKGVIEVLLFQSSGRGRLPCPTHASVALWRYQLHGVGRRSRRHTRDDRRNA